MLMRRKNASDTNATPTSGPLCSCFFDMRKPGSKNYFRERFVKMVSKLPSLCRRFSTFSVYDVKAGLVMFHNGRYLEILKAAPSTNKKLPSTYKLELLDLFANQVSKEYFRYSQLESLDIVDTTKLNVEFQYVDEERNLLIFSDDLYNQHEVPAYLFKGMAATIQPGARFTLLMDADRYIRII